MNVNHVAALTLIVASCLCCGQQARAAEPKPDTTAIPAEVLLWDIEPASGVSQEDAGLLTSFVAAEIERNGSKVRSKASVDKALKLEEQRQQCGADDVGCLAEVGNALGLDVAVSGSIGKLGETWICSLQLMDVRRVTVLKSVSRRVRGDIDAIVEQVPGMVREVLGKETTPAPAAVTDVETAMSAYTLWGHITFWSGVAIVGIGGAMTGLGKQAEQDYRDSASTSEEDAINAYRNASIALYTVGGALVLTGATLWLLDAFGADDIGDTGLTFAPSVGSGYTGAVVRLRF